MMVESVAGGEYTAPDTGYVVVSHMNSLGNELS